jgi:hypothetical protein
MDSGGQLMVLGRAAREIGEAATPSEVFAASDHAAAELIGHRLFTVLLFQPESGEVQRLYTSKSKEYPVGGKKPLRRDKWSETVIDRGEMLWLNDEEGIRQNFADHQTIFGLGCGAIINVPVRIGGKPVGTINILNRAGWFTEAHLPLARLVVSLATPGFLALDRR